MGVIACPNFCTFLLTNANLLDLMNPKEHLKVTWKNFSDWVNVFTGDDDVSSPRV